MMESQFIGTGVALITPFKSDYSIDYDGIEKVVEHVIAGGAQYLVPLGSTGESATLNDAEARSILDFVIKINKGRKPIVAGNFGGNNTLDLVQKIKGYNFEGIDAILSSSPAYVKPSQEGIFAHYMELEKVCPVPIILYNVPGRTRSNMEWQTTVRLANASDKFIGIKEATGDLIQASRIIKNKPEGFLVISGDDEVAVPMIACGGQGLISVIGNAFPHSYSTMIKAALDNKIEEARNINFQTYDLHKWLYIEGNPVGIKAAMSHMGFCERQVRLPLHPLSEKNMEELVAELDKIKIEHAVSS